MSRSFYLDLARRGLRLPLAADLFLHQEPEPARTRLDGVRLGQVIERAARQFGSPLAVPVMDLTLEKTDLLSRIGLSASEADRFHFSKPFDDTTRAKLARADVPPGPGSVAFDGALSYLRQETDLEPMGLVIAPFTLATKLMADPITAIALAGRGHTAEDDADVRLLFDCLEVAENLIDGIVRRQLAAGASSILICEPAASISYISPRQLEAGSAIFELLVMGPNLRLKETIEEPEADFLFHDCGELSAEMVRAFGHRLEPALLSLGSSRVLWKDAALVPDTVVLYGNLPSKSFYSDSVMPIAEVQRQTRELAAAMRATGHPFILGTECDVLHVTGADETIRRKVAAMVATEVPA